MPKPTEAKLPPRMVLKKNKDGIVEAVSLSFVFKPFPAKAVEYVSLAEHEALVKPLVSGLETLELGAGYFLEEDPDTSKKDAVESMATIARVALKNYRGGK